MYFIRADQFAAMGRLRAQELEAELVRRLHSPSNAWGAPDAHDTAAQVRAAIREAAELGFEQEAAVVSFVEMKLAHGDALALELGKASMRGILADASISADVKIDLLRRRVLRPRRFLGSNA